MLGDTDILAIKTGTLSDESTIQVVASALKNSYGENVPGLVCDSVRVPAPGHEPLADSALESLVREILPLATLAILNKSEAEYVISRKWHKVAISNLADMVSASKKLLDLSARAILLKGSSVSTTTMEVMMLLGKDPTISVYEYGLPDENTNILRGGLGGGDRVAQVVADVLQVSSGPNGKAHTSIFVRPRAKSADNTHGKRGTLSAASACGLARGLTSNLPFLIPVLKIHMVHLVPEVVRDGTIYAYLGILHAVRSGQGPSLNHNHSVVSVFVPRCVFLLSTSRIH